MSGGTYHFWLGASADADRVLSPSATEPVVSAHSGNARLREEWLTRFSNLYRDGAIEAVARSIARPIMEEFDGLEYGRKVDWAKLPEREKIPLRFIAQRALRAATSYCHTAKPEADK